MTDIISVATHKIVATVKQASPFCPNIAATPDGKQVWFTLKDSARPRVFNARPPFNVLKVFDTGPITNHVNIVHNANGSFAYVTIGGLNEVKVFRTDNFAQVATIPVGALPHGIWPSGDGTRVYVGLENGDGVTAIDTLTNKVIATTADRSGATGPDLRAGRRPERRWDAESAAARRWPGRPTHLSWLAPASPNGQGADQRDVVRPGAGAGAGGRGHRAGAETALCSGAGDAARRCGGTLQPLTAFMTNPAGAAIVNAIGPIRQIVQGDDPATRQYLVILSGTPDKLGAPVQVQVASPM